MPEKRAVMYLCAKVFDFASFDDISIGLFSFPTVWIS